MEDIDKNLDNLFGDNDKNEELTNSSSQEKINQEKPAPELLNNEQKLLILKRWEQDSENPPSIEELVKLAFPDVPNLDGRSRQGRAVKSYLANKDLKPRTKTEYQPKGLLTLTEEQKEFIRNNPNMRANEIAQALWNNLFFANNSQEVLSVKACQAELEKSGAWKKEVKGEEETSEEYRPPKTLDHVCARIRTYVRDNEWDSRKLTPPQKKLCFALISYLHDFRLVKQMDSYSNKADQELFEASFIKYVHDKGNLTFEDLDQFIQLCAHIVMEYSIKSQLDRLIEQERNEWETNNKVSTALVEYIQSTREDLDKCVKRQQSFYKVLTESRSEKLKEEIKDKESLLNLFNTWKNYESRQQLLKIRQKDKENLRKEIQDIESMDELKQRVLGLSVDQIIDG